MADPGTRRLRGHRRPPDTCDRDAPYPIVRAVGTMAILVSLYVLIFARVYLSISLGHPRSSAARLTTSRRCTSPSPCSRRSDWRHRRQQQHDAAGDVSDAAQPCRARHTDQVGHHSGAARCRPAPRRAGHIAALGSAASMPMPASFLWRLRRLERRPVWNRVPDVDIDLTSEHVRHDGPPAALTYGRAEHSPRRTTGAQVRVEWCNLKHAPDRNSLGHPRGVNRAIVIPQRRDQTAGQALP